MRIKSPYTRLLAGGVAALGFTVLSSSPALAKSAMTKVPAGILASKLPDVTVFGTTPAATPETVSFIFKENNLSALETKAAAGGFSYRPLTVSQFATQYGGSTTAEAALESYLTSYGITTSVLPGNVDVVANGTAGEFDSALDITEVDASRPAVKATGGSTAIPAQKFYSATTQPSLPSAWASSVLAILGLDDYSSQTTSLTHTIKGLTGKSSTSSSSNNCLAITGFSNDCNTPLNFDSDYGLNTLLGWGDKGQGQTIGIVTYASGDQSAPAYYWKNVLGLNTGSRKLTYVNVDGGAGTPSYNAGSDESDLDVEQSGAVAPAANIVVYQAPNDDSGAIDGLFTAASQNLAGSVSVSWGESETVIDAAIANGEEPTAYEEANDEAFLEMDAQGQASFVSSGDDGAYDAYDDQQTTNLAIDAPADSPYTTAAGGTTLPWSGNLTNKNGATYAVSVAKERTWGWDYLWPAITSLSLVSGETELKAAESAIAGSGGGFSVDEATPSYQVGVSGTTSYSDVPWLTPTTPTVYGNVTLPSAWTLNATPTVSTGNTATGRAAPDLATNADPYSGYVTYSPVLTEDSMTAISYGWGGTSFVAPQLNGAAADIDSAVKARVGFWNPLMYKAATSKSSPFTPLSTSGATNDNLYFTGTPGNVFNAGSGLGVPNLTNLAIDFAKGL